MPTPLFIRQTRPTTSGSGLQKEFKGIGLVLKEPQKGLIVTHMLEGGPAEKSKLIQIGDVLIEVDGESVVGQPFGKVMEKLHGEQNTASN